MSDMRQGQGKVIRGGESKENQGQVLKKKPIFIKKYGRNSEGEISEVKILRNEGVCWKKEAVEDSKVGFSLMTWESRIAEEGWGGGEKMVWKQ